MGAKWRFRAPTQSCAVGVGDAHVSAGRCGAWCSHVCLPHVCCCASGGESAALGKGVRVAPRWGAGPLAVGGGQLDNEQMNLCLLQLVVSGRDPRLSQPPTAVPNCFCPHPVDRACSTRFPFEKQSLLSFSKSLVCSSPAPVLLPPSKAQTLSPPGPPRETPPPPQLSPSPHPTPPQLNFSRLLDPSFLHWEIGVSPSLSVRLGPGWGRDLSALYRIWCEPPGAKGCLPGICC